MTGGNKSTAVMARRNSSKASLDDFPTPPWATLAMQDFVIKSYIPQERLAAMTAWEPACNRGFMADACADSFGEVIATDIADYGYKAMHSVFDFCGISPPPDDIAALADAGGGMSDLAIITNPPFTLAADFICRALSLKPGILAIFARLALAEGKQRWSRIWEKTPPAIVAPFVERVPLVEGKYDPEASSATAYAWFIWLDEAALEYADRDFEPTKFIWIPPCRRELESRRV